MERVWDEADYVVPPAENGAFFVTTNIIVTPNQTWGSCPEVSRLRQKKALKANSCSKLSSLF
jgi:P2X purinoceptor 4